MSRAGADAAWGRLTVALFIAATALAFAAASIGFVMPALRVELGLDPRAASWLLTIMVLGLLIGTPVGAVCVRRWGGDRAFRTACALTAAGSALGALSVGYPSLLAAQLVQGLGSGPILAIAAVIVTRRWPAERHGRMLSALSVAYGLAFLLGMIAAPALLLASWRLIFAAQAVMALIAIAVLPRSAEAPSRAADGRWDVAGLVTWTLALACLSVGINSVHGGGGADVRVVGATAIGLALAAAFVWLERRAVTPMLPLALFGARDMRAVALLSVGTGIGQALCVLMPSVAIARLGVSASSSGVLLLPMVLGGIAAGVHMTLSLDRIGPRVVLVAGSLAMLAGGVAGGLLPPGRATFLVAAALVGVGISWLSGGPLRYVAARAVPDALIGAAQGAVVLFTNVGVLIGSAVMGAMAAWGPDDRAGMERALLAATIVMAVTFIPVARLRPSAVRPGRR